MEHATDPARFKQAAYQAIREYAEVLTNRDQFPRDEWRRRLFSSVVAA